MRLALRILAISALIFSRTAVANQLENIQADAYDRRKSGGGDKIISDKGERLISIPSLYGKNIRQPYSNLKDLYSISHSASAELRDLLKNAVKGTNAMHLNASIKSIDRAQAKIESDFNGDVGKITDIVRDSIVASNIEEAYSIFYTLKESIEVVQVKNRFAQPQPSGYRDLSLLVRLKESKMIAEIQVHLKDIAEIKSGVEHSVYEAIQILERAQKSQGIRLSEFEREQIEIAKETSRDLYQTVWSKQIS